MIFNPGDYEPKVCFAHNIIYNLTFNIMIIVFNIILSFLRYGYSFESDRSFVETVVADFYVKLNFLFTIFTISCYLAYWTIEQSQCIIMFIVYEIKLYITICIHSLFLKILSNFIAS